MQDVNPEDVVAVHQELIARLVTLGYLRVSWPVPRPVFNVCLLDALAELLALVGPRPYPAPPIAP